jgi:hypothetical protein
MCLLVAVHSAFASTELGKEFIATEAPSHIKKYFCQRPEAKDFDISKNDSVKKTPEINGPTEIKNDV